MYGRVAEIVIEKSWARWADRERILHLKIERRRGWPDRMVMLGNSHVFFIEFKTSHGKTRKLQEYIHEILRDKGYHVYICYSKDEAIEATIIESRTPKVRNHLRSRPIEA